MQLLSIIEIKMPLDLELFTHLLLSEQTTTSQILAMASTNVELNKQAQKHAFHLFYSWTVLQLARGALGDLKLLFTETLLGLYSDVSDDDIRYWMDRDLANLEKYTENGLEPGPITDMVVNEEDDILPVPKIMTVIGTWFMSRCPNLVWLSLSPVPQVTTIQNWFAYKSANLEAVDLSDLQNLTEIGNFFLAHCSSLRVLLLNPNARIKKVGNFFLLNCSSLRTIDMRPLADAQVGTYYMRGCTLLGK